MYLDIGFDLAVREDSVVGIFDLDNTTWSKHTRSFLAQAERDGLITEATDGLPKSFLLTSEYGLSRVYLTRFNAAILEKRLNGESSLARSNYE